MARQTPRANTACNYPCWTARFIIFRTLHVFIDKLLGGAEDIVQIYVLNAFEYTYEGFKVISCRGQINTFENTAKEIGANTTCTFPYLSDLDCVICECRTTTKSV
jgi:hypothetical protein